MHSDDAEEFSGNAQLSFPLTALIPPDVCWALIALYWVHLQKTNFSSPLKGAGGPRQGNWGGSPHQSRFKVSQGTRDLRAGLLTPSSSQIMTGTHQSYAVQPLNFKSASMDGAEPAFRPPATQKVKNWVCFYFITQSTRILPLLLMTGGTK